MTTRRVSEQTRFAVALAVATGSDTMPSVSQALGTTRTTASHALRHLVDDGYIARHRYEGGRTLRVLYRYTLLRMPPAPVPSAALEEMKRGPVPEPRYSTLLDEYLPRPELPQGTVSVVHRLAGG